MAPAGDLRDYLGSLPDLIAGARQRGSAYARVGPATVVTVTDIQAVKPDQATPWTNPPPGESWIADDPDRIARSNLGRQLIERRVAPPSYLAPLAIFPLCAEDIVDILMGQLDFVTWISPRELRAAYTAKGIQVDIAAGRDADRRFLTASRDGEVVTLPAHARELMLRELVTVETIVDITDELLTSSRRGALEEVDRIIVCDERTTWPPAPRHMPK